MAQTQTPPGPLTDGTTQMQHSLWRRLFSGWDKDNGTSGPAAPAHTGRHHGEQEQDDGEAGLMRRVSRKVVPGLPRAQTFKRQRSEMRSRLEPVHPTPAERRAVSVDRRGQASNSVLNHSDPRASAPDFLHNSFDAAPSPPSLPISPIEGQDDMRDLDTFDLDGESVDGALVRALVRATDDLSRIDVQSMTTSQYDALIESEMERKWILNLSMHFRDKSKREKFFVTYRQHEHQWRRVTVSLDYRNAPENSLEADLARTQYQRDKSAKIYEAIRESLNEIEFYSTVTNLKLETKDGRLHVHVVEDVNEIISYPAIRMVQHMNCRRVKEREIHFDSHMSGFVYKVRVHGRLLIKKEIPGPETIDEFLYEINALNQLCHAKHVIHFYGIVVDDREEHITGLLISYASRGALIDVIYDSDHSLPWPIREKWARQIVGGLSEIHEAGFVQGDFTLSNIVIDENDDAMIIDINRRGCPIGWEPPEATPLVESNQRISMYIGVKSDLYQLGMVLWALATQEDEPEAYGRPLKIDPDVQVPAWYRRIVDICLSPDPRNRVQASQLLSWFPDNEIDSQYGRPIASSMSMNGDSNSRYEYMSPVGMPRIKTVHPPSDWSYVGWGNSHLAEEPFYYPSRGRSPPSPMPSNQGDYDSPRYPRRAYTWSDTFQHAPIAPSISDLAPRDSKRGFEPGSERSDETLETYAEAAQRTRESFTETNRDDDDASDIDRGRSLTRSNAYYDRGVNASATGQDVGSSGSWVPPKHWMILHTECETGSENGNSRRRDPGRRGNTGPESRADSGKDVTEAINVPREYRERSGSPESGRKLSREPSLRLDGRLGATATTTTDEPLHHQHPEDKNDSIRDRHPHSRHQEHERGHRYDRDGHQDEHSRLRRSSPSLHGNQHAQYRRSEEDLKGVGSAHDSSSKPGQDLHDRYDDEKRHNAMILEDLDHHELGSELDSELRQVFAANNKDVPPVDDRRR
ncbi:hypothetical protein VTI74DRAFT_10854 [Chaetomium olivicolor]